MTENSNTYYKTLLFFILTTCILLFSCNSKNSSLIGGTWKIQSSETEFKINGKFEKIDSITNYGLLFNEISFENNKEFTFSSKGISDDKDEKTSIIGGSGFYHKTDNNIVLEYSMQRKSLKFKIDSTQLILVENLIYEENQPMIISSQNNSEIKVTEVKNTFYYKK